MSERRQKNVNGERETGRRAGAAVIAALAVAFALLGVMSALTLWSADDMLYATFLDSGWREYARLLSWHYQEFNGRVLVHIAAQMILHFPMWAFVLASLAAALTIPLAAGAAAGLQRRQLSLAASSSSSMPPDLAARYVR